MTKKHPKPRRVAARKAVLRSVLILGAIAAVPALLGAALVMAPMIPLNPEALGEQWPARSVMTRTLSAEGCGLTQTQTVQGCKPTQVLGIKEEEVEIPSSLPDKGLAALEGTLLIPEGPEGRRPAVLLVAGSGPTPRDAITQGDLVHKMRKPFPLMKAMAEHLAKQGLAVLRYDKRSCVACYKDQEYQFKPATFRFTDFVQDACDAIDVLAAHPSVDPKKIIVLGHSQGAHHSAAIASCPKAKDKVVAVVMLAGPVRGFGDTLLEQFETLAELRKERFDWITALTIEGQHEVYKDCLDKLDDEGLYQPDEICIGGGVTQAALKDYEVFLAKVPEQIGALRVPVFYALGNADRNIQPEEFGRMETILRGHDAELHMLGGVSHTLTNAVEDPDPTVIDTVLLEKLDTFLGSVH